MGLKFDEVIYGKLTEDSGGHPYLMRHICSVIHRISKSERPARVDKTIYNQALKIFLRDYGQYLEMILSVLKEYFYDEYDMLRMLARGDIDTFKEFADISALYTNHLVGYGVLQEVDNRFDYRIETIRTYLQEKEKYKKLHMSLEEKMAEISERRNNLEIKLRTLCRMQLLANLGEPKAQKSVLEILGSPRSVKFSSLSYKDLFDGNKSKIYFVDILKIISKYWDCFRNIVGPDMEKFKRDMITINELRADAHAREITDEEMSVFRVSASRIEQSLSQYFL